MQKNKNIKEHPAYVCRWSGKHINTDLPESVIQTCQTNTDSSKPIFFLGNITLKYLF